MKICFSFFKDYIENYVLVLKKRKIGPTPYLCVPLSSEIEFFCTQFFLLFSEKEIVINSFLCVYNNNWGRSPSQYARYNNKTKAIEENKKKTISYTKHNETNTKQNTHKTRRRVFRYLAKYSIFPLFIPLQDSGGAEQYSCDSVAVRPRCAKVITIAEP